MGNARKKGNEHAEMLLRKRLQYRLENQNDDSV